MTRIAKSSRTLIITVLLPFLAGTIHEARLAAAPPALAPTAPKLDALPLKGTLSQYGITWTFDKPAHVGEFITGDYYVVGPVTVTAIDPAPGNDRNGSMLNPATGGEQGYAKIAGGFAATLVYNPRLMDKPPIAMKLGDSLVSTISWENGDGNKRPALFGFGTSGAASKTAAVLTCLEAPVPPDTFRPSYCGHQSKLYRYSDLHTELLLKVQPTASMPPWADYERLLQRPWIDHVYGWGTREIHPSENMPDYGQSIGRIMSVAALMLSCDAPLEQKKKLLVGVVQYGVDLYGCIERGCKGWPQQGGFGAGRKWPILFTGVLLKDEAMQHPQAEFAEDEGHDFDHSWTGANVVFNGHSGKEAGPSAGDPDRASYEYLHPSLWTSTTSETYRRNSTSSSYVGFALVARMMHLEGTWGHDAFFAYVDRWMGEDDARFYEAMTTVFKQRWSAEGFWDHQGHSLEKFVNEMWAKYRFSEGMPPSGYKPIPAVETGNVQIGPNRAFVVDGKPFLPLMLLFQGPEQIEFAKSVGLNTFLGNGWTSNKFANAKSLEFLDQLAAAGMYGVFGPDARLCGQKNLLGWLQYNQPDAVTMVSVPDITLDAAHKPERGFPLSRLVDGITNKQCLLSPLANVEITIKVKEPVTAQSLALWLEKGGPQMLKDVAFLLDGKEVLKTTVEQKGGQHQWPLPAPVTFKTLTLKVLSVYDSGEANKWGSIDEIQALDRDGQPLPLFEATYTQAVPAVCTNELYQWFGRMDKSRPVFVDCGAFAAKPPAGWAPEAKARLYPELFKACDVTGLEPAGLSSPADLAAAVSDMGQSAGPGRPVFAVIDLSAKNLAPAALRARVWSAVTAGATAIGYRAGEKADRLSGELKVELKRLNEELTRLAPVILAAPSKTRVTLAGRASRQLRATETGGTVTIFAVNLGEDAGKATIKVDGLKAGTKIDVVDENRTIDAQDGSFADDYPVLREHVYRIKMNG